MPTFGPVSENATQSLTRRAETLSTTAYFGRNRRMVSRNSSQRPLRSPSMPALFGANCQCAKSRDDAGLLYRGRHPLERSSAAERRDSAKLLKTNRAL